jgi:hypothetical protein
VAVSAKWFGAAGDGVADDTTEVQAAVTFCYSSGDWLYWPDGTYLTTASIDNLHSVRHSGPGVIKRGSDLFYVDPVNSQSNSLYVSTIGTTGNDGLSSSQPTTIAQALSNLSNYGPVLSGSWNIVGAAGTYNQVATSSVPQFTEMRNRLTIKGPTVAHPSVPTMILDGGSAAIIGISSIGPAKLGVEYVKFQNFLPSVGGGVYAIDGANLYTNNVHIDNCTDGIYSIRSSIIRVKGGIVANCTQGIVCSVGSTGSVGYNAASLADGTIVDACTTGVSVGEVSSCHVDYTTIKNCTGRGVLSYDNSRINLISPDFQDNAVATETRTGGVISETTPDYNVGEATANTVNRRILGQLPSNFFATTSRPINRVVFNRSSALTHTGDTNKTTLLTPFTIPADWFVEEDREIRIKIWGIKTGAAATVEVGVDFGATEIFKALNAGGAGAHSFMMEAVICSTGPTSQLYWYDHQTNLPGTRMGVGIASAADMTVANAINITVQLGNSADSIQLKGISIDFTG